MGTGLSKSKYVTFCNCPKALWLKVNKPDKEIIDPGVASRFEEGNIVGDLAMEYFGKFVEVTSFDSNGKLDLTAMIKKTNDEIVNGTKVICEASFTNNGNYCAVDILKKNGKAYDIYEVKSSTDAEKEVYYRDVAYQKWVLEKCGLDIKNVYLMNINSDYVMEDELDIKKLFKVTLLNNVIEPYYKDVSKNVTAAKKVLQSTDEPTCPLGEYCFNPYDCGFFNYCTKGMKRPNVLDLYRLPDKKKVEYLNTNIKTFRQLKNKELNKIQKMQISAELDGEEFIDKEGIKSFLDTLKYPLYFFDFETIQPVLPKYKGTRPYQQIPFQYSLHILDKKGGKLTHKEFLAESNDINPTDSLVKQMCKDIPDDVTVIVFNDTFEKTRIKEMEEMYPKKKKHLEKIRNNIVDLIDPFRDGYYYNKQMNGSFSIKAVLPALFPDDPMLNYHNLEGDVHNGGDAMSIFPKMKDMSKEEREKARKDLLEYCGLDTYAMVKVLEKLYEVSK